MILARLEGGPLENTGVIAGMSGSPVYIDGKLVGAVAYGFPFSKETIARHHAHRRDDRRHRAPTRPRAASARFPAAVGRRAARRPRWTATPLVAALQRPLPAVLAGRGRACAATCRRTLAASRWPRSSLPLVFSGFDPADLRVGARASSPRWASRPVMGTGDAARCPREPLPDLAAGRRRRRLARSRATWTSPPPAPSPTSTSGRVYAFGHPFYNLGPDAVPDEEGVRLLGVPEPLPVLEDQLRRRGRWAPSTRTAPPPSPARLGKTPRMIPVEVKLTHQPRPGAHVRVPHRGGRAVQPGAGLRRPWPPCCRATSAPSAPPPSAWTRALTLSGGREVRVEDLFTEEQPAHAGRGPGGRAARLPHDRTTSSAVTVEKLAGRGRLATRPSRARPCSGPGSSAPAPCAPGTTVPLKVLLRTYRGETRVARRSRSRSRPARPPGTYSLLVADGAVADRARAARDAPALRAHATSTSSSAPSTACAATTTSTRACCAPTRAPSCAASTCSRCRRRCSPCWAASEQGGSVVPLRTAAVWDFDLPTDYAVSGSRVLTLTVER